MPSRRIPKPWSVEPMPSGYRVIDANGIILAHVYGRPDEAISVSDARLTNDEARRITHLQAVACQTHNPDIAEGQVPRRQSGM
jgi:hypothetical protein